MSTAFVFDLDGTLTEEELLPKFSAAVGLHEVIALLTRLTLDGQIPFVSSFKLRCALLKSIPLSRAQNIARDTKMFPLVEDFISRNRNTCFVNTGNLDAWVSPLAERLGCRFFSSVADTEGDALLGIRSILNKGDTINHLKKTFARVVAIGDSHNDIAMFERADICIAYGATHEPIAQLKEIADFIIYNEASLCRLLNML